MKNIFILIEPRDRNINFWQSKFDEWNVWDGVNDQVCKPYKMTHEGLNKQIKKMEMKVEAWVIADSISSM